MSVDPAPAPDTAFAALAARVRASERRADRRLESAIDDFFRIETDRLGDRTRAAIGTMIDSTIERIEGEIAAHAARLLVQRGDQAGAAVLSASNTGVTGRLAHAGLLRDRDLMAELVAQARVVLIDEALVAKRPPDTPATLLARLAESADGIVRSRALGYMIADSRRRLPSRGMGAELPAGLHRRLAWWVAAALRDRLGEGHPLADRALADATARSNDAREENEGVAVAARQLALALAPEQAEVPALLVDCLIEGRVSLFVAVLAQALAIDADDARALVTEPESDLLWLALRSIGCPRDWLARIGWLLGEADDARDVEALPDAIDAVAGIAPDAAREAIAALTLDRDYRAALRLLTRDEDRG